MAVLSVGVVAVFTAFNAVIMMQKASEDMFDQSLEINSIVEDLRVSMPEGVQEKDVQSQAVAILSKYSGWTLEEATTSELPGLYTFKLSYKTESGKQRFFYAKVYYS